MKKIITLTICLALICSSVAPAFAATNSVNYFYDGFNTQNSISAYQVMTGIRSSLSGIYSYVSVDLMEFLKLTGSGSTPSSYRSFQDIAADVLNIATELDVSTISGAYTIKELLEMIGDSAANIQLDTPYIVSNTSSIDYYTQSNNTRLNNIDQDLDKYFGQRPWLTSYSENRDWYQDYYLVDSDNGSWGDISTERDKYATYTSKLDFVLRLLQALNFNQAKEYNQLYTDVDSQLSIWDSQGNTLSQSYWTPTSGFNGLYKYLAFTQRDVARLTHVYASDEEIAARDAARQNQTAVVNNFVDGNGVGSVSASDLGDMASVSGSLQSNFDTGASVSGVFAFFSNGSSTNWFSQATKDALDTNQTRSNSCDTPLLDAYYEEIYDLLGIGDDNR